MDIQTITKWLFVAIIVLPLVGLPVYIHFRRGKDPDQADKPSPLAYAWTIGIAAFVGYWVGVSVGIGVECSDGGGNLCGLAGYFIYGPLFALAAAVLAPLILFATGKRK